MKDARYYHGASAPLWVESERAGSSWLFTVQDVRYVIHTITFCAVFGSEKVYFPVKNCTLYFYFAICVFEQNAEFQKKVF